MSRTTVVYEDLGLGTLERDAERLLEDVLDVAAEHVEKKMRLNIEDRGYVDTRATKASVAVSKAGRLARDIGPSTHYALLGELGWLQTHVWGRKLAEPIHHPGLHFARDALSFVKSSFVKAVGAAMQKLGGR